MWCQPQVLITGLQTPHKLILTPRGNLLVAETSMASNSGRVSLVTRAGVRRSLLEALPSGTEVAGGAAGPSGMALRDRTLYVSFGAGEVERRLPSGTSTLNPAGASSPLFNSILVFQFSADIDGITGTFRPTAAQQRTLADGAEVQLDDGSGSTTRVSLLVKVPDAEPDANIVYRFSNLWGLVLSEDGRTLFVNDASINALMSVDTATGRWRRIARFAPSQNPGRVGPPVIDAVPTSVRVYGSQVLVSFLTGFPFIPGTARVLAVNAETGATEPFIFGLTSATDVLWRSRPNARPQFFVTEFSLNQSANPAPPGRLIRFDTADPQVGAAPLITPVSMAFDEATQDLFILELRGQILRLHID